jgi:hypothetical protein
MPDGRFYVSFPCWFLVRGVDNTADGPRIGPGTTLQTMSSADGLSVPVFTDEDLASRFADDSDLPDDVMMIPCADPPQLVAWLETAREAGTAAVVFDPLKATGNNRRVWAINYAIEQLKKG